VVAYTITANDQHEWGIVFFLQFLTKIPNYGYYMCTISNHYDMYLCMLWGGN